MTWDDAHQLTDDELDELLLPKAASIRSTSEFGLLDFRAGQVTICSILVRSSELFRDTESSSGPRAANSGEPTRSDSIP